MTWPRKRYLSTGEVADLSGVNPEKVRRRWRRGWLKGTKPGPVRGARLVFTWAEKAGDVRTIELWDSMADALSARRPGELPFRYLKKYLDDILLVSEEAIAESVRTILFRTKTLAEPGGATAAAAFLDGLVDNGRVTVAIASGGNIQPSVLERILAGSAAL